MVGDNYGAELLPRRLEVLVSLTGRAELDAIEESAEAAVHGDSRAIRRYASAYRQLVRKVFEQLQGEEGAPLVPQVARAVALNTADTALFTQVAQHRGPRLGAVMAILEPTMTKGEFVEAVDLLIEGEEHTWAITVRSLSESQSRTFMRFASQLLAAESPLTEIRDTFQLTDTELGELFQVSRPAVQQWLLGEIPAKRRPRVYAVHKVAKLLSHHLKPDRIPSVVRRSSPWFGGRSILAALKDGDHEQVLQKVRESFDWGRAA